MSAAFALDYSGPPVPCDFRGCILDSWHDGDHEFAKAAKPIQWNYDRHCVVCGVFFTVLNADRSLVIHTCGSQACVEHWASRHPSVAPLLCCCPQREYPHELSVHSLISSEWYAHRNNPSWPWSLMLSPKLEPSTERKAA